MEIQCIDKLHNNKICVCAIMITTDKMYSSGLVQIATEYKLHAHNKVHLNVLIDYNNSSLIFMWNMVLYFMSLFIHYM